MTNNTNNIGLEDEALYEYEFYRKIYEFIMKPIELNIEEYENCGDAKSVEKWKKSAAECIEKIKIIIDPIIPKDRLTEDQINQLKALKKQLKDWRCDFKHLELISEEAFCVLFNALYILSTSITQGGVLTENQLWDLKDSLVQGGVLTENQLWEFDRVFKGI